MPAFAANTTVHSRCMLIWETSNTSGTITLAAKELVDTDRTLYNEHGFNRGLWRYND